MLSSNWVWGIFNWGYKLHFICDSNNLRYNRFFNGRGYVHSSACTYVRSIQCNFYLLHARFLLRNHTGNNFFSSFKISCFNNFLVTQKNIRTIRIYYAKIIFEIIFLILAPAVCAVVGFWLVYLVGLVTPFFIVSFMVLFAVLQLYHIYSLVIINSLRRKIEINAYVASVILENANDPNEFQDFFEQTKTEQEKVYVM